MSEGQHDKICKFLKSKMKSPYLSEKIVRFWWNLVHYIRYWTRLKSRNQKLKFLKLKMAAAAILTIAYLAITHRPKFCLRKQNGMLTRTKWQNLQIFKIQDGERPPFWKSLNHHISVKNRPILMKLGTLHQILNLITVTWPKIEIFEIQDNGGRILKIPYLAVTHQPNVCFQRHFAIGSRTVCRQRPRHINCNFL